MGEITQPEHRAPQEEALSAEEKMAEIVSRERAKGYIVEVTRIPGSVSGFDIRRIGFCEVPGREFLPRPVLD
jgi:hypothetical protein